MEISKKKKRHLYNQYTALSNALSRRGLKRPGKLAQHLLQFYNRPDFRVYVYADVLRDLGVLGVSESHPKYLQMLINWGFLEMEGEYRNRTYYAGDQLKAFFHREQLARGELATKQELQAMHRQLSARLDIHEKALFGHILATDPPFTEEKKRLWLEANNALAEKCGTPAETWGHVVGEEIEMAH